MDFEDHLLAADEAVAATFGQTGLQYRTGAGVVVDLWDPASLEPRAIFTENYVALDGNNAPLASMGPALFVTRLSDLPVDPETEDGADVLKNGVVYHVKNARPDGAGGVTLFLHKDTV